MDDELRAFLIERFAAVDQRLYTVDQRLDALEGATGERFSAVDRRFDAVDQRLAAIDHRFAAIDRRTDEVRRELGVVVEGQRDQIRLIAEGHSLLVGRIDGLERTIESMGREILAAVKFSYAELDRRITRLEALTVDLEARLSRLEREHSRGPGP